MSESINISKEISNDGNKSLTYRKSWEKNGLNHSKEVRKVEGGYIVVESKYGKPKDQGEDAEYIDERKEYVTTENPFDEAEKKTDDEKMFDFIDVPSLM